MHTIYCSDKVFSLRINVIMQNWSDRRVTVINMSPKTFLILIIMLCMYLQMRSDAAFLWHLALGSRWINLPALPLLRPIKNNYKTWQLRMHCNLRPPDPRQPVAALITTPCQVWCRRTYPLPYYSVFAADTLLTMWPWPLIPWPWPLT